MLVNRLTGPLTDEDFEKAKYVVENQILVGLASNVTESMVHFAKYFGWTYDPVCLDPLLSGSINKNTANPKAKVVSPEDQEAISIITGANQYDIWLYEIAEKKFKSQAVWLGLESPS